MRIYYLSPNCWVDKTILTLVAGGRFELPTSGLWIPHLLVISVTYPRNRCRQMQTKHLNADKMQTKCGHWIYYPVPTPPPWHTQISASNCDYGLQYKSAVKRIFILFFTKMVMEGVW